MSRAITRFIRLTALMGATAMLALTERAWGQEASDSAKSVAGSCDIVVTIGVWTMAAPRSRDPMTSHFR